MALKSRYVGATTVINTSANQHLILGGITLTKFKFMNKADCTIVVNDSDQLCIFANQGYESKLGEIIYLFKVVTAGVDVTWNGRT